MGTSGSYGGSSSSAWARARQRLDGMTPLGDGAGAQDPATDTAAGDAAAALAQALQDGESALRRPSAPTFSLGSLLPRIGARPGGGGHGGGGGGGGGGARGSSTGNGRTGGRSSRSLTRSAQRSGAVVAAAFALRRGDGAGLAELGLDLGELQQLQPMAQCDRILQAILGNETHPDEYALRRASAEAARAVITGRTDQPIEVVRNLVADLVWQQGLVELRAQREAGVDAKTVAGKETRIKRWIQAKVRALAAPASGFMTVTDILTSVGSMTQTAVRILAAGTTA
jgi:hypothetical protein